MMEAPTNLRKIKIKQKSFKVIHHDANSRKCKAMLTGVIYSKNQNICVMDGDGQNPPYEAKSYEFLDKN